MKTFPLGLFAVIVGVIGMGLIFLSSIQNIEHGITPQGIPFSHVYLIAFAIITAGGLITNAVESRR